MLWLDNMKGLKLRPSYVRNMYPLQKRNLFFDDGEKVLSQLPVAMIKCPGWHSLREKGFN